ncbi:MAG TPA: sigma-70 family RNA polymerase sigma factor [Gemmatimonadales bacterium]|nr:sigma-70 family RNA polymerase sigma factor [Gemmatimonadales bacterium]
MLRIREEAEAAQTVPPQHDAEAVCRDWYETYGGALYSYLRFHLPSPDLAEDLTAEVFLRALKAYERFSSSLGSPRPWLFRIAQNVLRDHLRQARRRQLVSIAGMRDLECEAPSPEERLLWEEEVARLLAALAELSPNDREVIGLCYSSDLSMAEAGEVLGLSATATRTRLWRALGRLRKVLTP